MLQTKTDKVIFYLFLVCFGIFILLSLLDYQVESSKIGFGIASVTFPMILIIWYIIKSGLSRWLIIFTLYLIFFSALLLKFLHLPAADLLMIIGYFTYPIQGFMLLHYFYTQKNSNDGSHGYLPIISVSLLLYSLLMFLEFQAKDSVFLFTQAVMVATILTAYYREVNFTPVIGRVLTATLVSSLLYLGASYLVILR